MVTTEEVLRLKQRLKATWKDIMPDANSVAVWRDTFEDYTFKEVEHAAVEYMKTNYYKPTPADIIACIPARIPAAAYKPAPQKKYETMPDGKVVRVVKCKWCRDSGLIITTSPTGIDQGRPCTHCEMGRINYPWYFLTEQEKADYNAKELKAGRSVPNYYYAPDDFRKAYLYGDSEPDET